MPSSSTNEPDWRDLIDDELDQPLDRPARRSIGVNFRAESNLIVREAAKKRDVSMGAYVRMAALAFAAYDLDSPLEDATAHEAAVKRFDGTTADPNREPLVWEIERLGGRHGHESRGVRGVHTELDA